MKFSNATLLTFILVSAFTAQAANLRVSNISSVGCEFSSLSDAVSAASDGDCIILDGSPTAYGDIILRKSITIQGPGYYLSENGLVERGASSAQLGVVKIYSENVSLKGLDIDNIEIYNDGTTINRCRIGAIKFGTLSDGITERPAGNAIIHQNYINGYLIGASTGYSSQTMVRSSNVQITNNIFKQQEMQLYKFQNSLVAHNTFRSNNAPDITNCLVERNIGINAGQMDKSNTTADNITHSLFGEFAGTQTDKDFLEIDDMCNQGRKYGAFSGDNPYILGGIPAGPVIEMFDIPTSVEINSDFAVTLKIGKSK